MASAGGSWVKVTQGNIGQLVFVPRGQTVAQVLLGHKAAAGAGLPESLDGLKVVKGLGGSTGAQLVQDENGNLYVMKKGGNAGHLLEEGIADSAYRAMGLDVPEHKIYQTANGPVKLARFVEGQTLDHAMSNDKPAADGAFEKLRAGFAADAVLGNWDVIGLGYDNVLIGKNGAVYRIDNGGSLRYRAQGALKSKFDEFPMELWSMRSQGTAGNVFGKMTWTSVIHSAFGMAGQKQAVVNAMPAALKGVMSARIDRMMQAIKIHNVLAGNLTSDQVASYTQKLWSKLQSGAKILDPQTPAQIIQSFNEIGS